MLEKVEENTIYAHHKGELYRVLFITNKTPKPPKFEPTVIYEHLKSREKYSRPLEDFKNKFSQNLPADHIRVYQAEFIECMNCHNVEEGSSPWGCFTNQGDYYTCNQCGTSCVRTGEFEEYRDYD